MTKDLVGQKNNIQVIDMVRSLAIFSVLARHLADVFPPALSLSPIWTSVTSNGVGGVFMFLVVSGFLITRIIDMGSSGLYNPSWKDFYVRRVARIIPLYSLHIFGGFILTVLLVLLSPANHRLFGMCFKLTDVPFDPSFCLSLLTFSFNWVEAFKYDQWGQIGAYWVILWSLAVEEQFYILYPIYLKILGSVKRLVSVLIALVIFCLFWKFNFPANWPRTVVTALRINVIAYGEIGIGILLYLTAKHFGGSLAKKSKWCLFFSMTGALLILLSYSAQVSQSDIQIKALIIGSGVFLFLLGSMHLSVYDSKYLRGLALPGKYSYSAYLFHIAILYFMTPFLFEQDRIFALFVYLAVTTLVSAAIYHLFEFPMNNFIRGRFKISLKTKSSF